MVTATTTACARPCVGHQVDGNRGRKAGRRGRGRSTVLTRLDGIGDKGQRESRKGKVMFSCYCVIKSEL